MALPRFIFNAGWFGQNNVPMSYEEMKKQQEAALAFAAQRGRATDVGTGLGHMLTGLTHGILAARAKRGMARQSSDLAALRSGGSGPYNTPWAPADVTADAPQAPEAPGAVNEGSHDAAAYNQTGLPPYSPPSAPEPTGTTAANGFVEYPELAGQTASVGNDWQGLNQMKPVKSAYPQTYPSDNLKLVEQFIREEAVRQGINPDVAVRVAKSEGLARGAWQSNISGKRGREPSYGPFQLLVGGPGTSFPSGMGNKMIAETGVDPRNKDNWKEAIAYGLSQAKNDGWRQWYGAAKVGVNRWDGITDANSDYAYDYSRGSGDPGSAVVTSDGQQVPVPTPTFADRGGSDPTDYASQLMADMGNSVSADINTNFREMPELSGIVAGGTPETDAQALAAAEADQAARDQGLVPSGKTPLMQALTGMRNFAFGDPPYEINQYGVQDPGVGIDPSAGMDYPYPRATGWITDPPDFRPQGEGTDPSADMPYPAPIPDPRMIGQGTDPSAGMPYPAPPAMLAGQGGLNPAENMPYPAPDPRLAGQGTDPSAGMPYPAPPVPDPRMAGQGTDPAAAPGLPGVAPADLYRMEMERQTLQGGGPVADGGGGVTEEEVATLDPTAIPPGQGGANPADLEQAYRVLPKTIDAETGEEIKEPVEEEKPEVEVKPEDTSGTDKAAPFKRFLEKNPEAKNSGQLANLMRSVAAGGSPGLTGIDQPFAQGVMDAGLVPSGPGLQSSFVERTNAPEGMNAAYFATPQEAQQSFLPANPTAGVMANNQFGQQRAQLTREYQKQLQVVNHGAFGGLSPQEQRMELAKLARLEKQLFTPPTLQTTYDDQGREIKVLMDQWGNVIRQVGGAKQNNPLVTINGEALRNPGDTTAPDEEGNFVRLMPDGSLQADVVKDSQADLKRQKMEREKAKWVEEYDERQKARGKSDQRRSMGVFQQMQAANNALKIMEDTRDDWIKPEGWGSYLTFLRGLGENQAQNLQGYIDTIKAQIGMENLNKLREASGTGASGLGQVTEREHYLLQAMEGYLNNAATAEHLIFALVAIPMMQQAIVEGEFYDQNGNFSTEIRDARAAEITAMAERMTINLTGKTPLRNAPLGEPTPPSLSVADPLQEQTIDSIVEDILKGQ